MPAQIQSDNPILHGKFLHLIMPLRGLPTKAVNENKSPLGMIRRNIDRRKPHQRICGNTYFMPVEVEVYVHVGSLQGYQKIVNFVILRKGEK